MAESRRQGHHPHFSSTPVTASELQLYRVLERANLGPYYSNFIHQGGDDVQQLCEAGEDEFLEIMSLVGMGSKPLHVRRLQKALQEWVANPGSFQEPLPAQQGPHSQLGSIDSPLGMSLPSLPNSHHSTGRWPTGNSGSSPSHAASTSSSTGARSSPGSSQQVGTPTTPSSFRPVGNLASPSPAAFNAAPIGRTDNPVMARENVENLRAAAEQLVRTEGISSLPLNKKVTKEVEYILSMSQDHPNRMEEIRKWSSIYGRFDSKRKLDKPLTLHEVTVNEAAAQLCTLDPNLIIMREKLFPLARRVVRDSGYQFRHGHSRAGKSKSHKGQSKSKRAKMAAEVELNPNPRTVQAEIMKIRREERMNEITTLLSSIKTQQYDLKAKIAIAKAEDNLQKVYDLQLELEKMTTQQLAYMTEQTDLIKKHKRSDRYYVAKAAKVEDGEDEEHDESLLHDDSSNLLHEDQQQQQQQQQPLQQHHQQQQQQTPLSHQHMASQQAQSHHGRRSKCSPPHMKQEDGYREDSNTQMAHYGDHSPAGQHHRTKNHQGSRNTNNTTTTTATTQHYNPTTAATAAAASAAAAAAAASAAARAAAAATGNGINFPPQDQVLLDPVDGGDQSHPGKRATHKAQHQMMQHVLVDEGYRLATKTFGTYQPPYLNIPTPMSEGAHQASQHHMSEQQQILNVHSQPMTLLHQ